jgi:hypothetical protein
MRRLRATVAVDCPIDQAQARIERFFAAHRSSDGTLRIPLRVPIGRADGGFALDHEVRVEARTARDDQNLNELIRLSWRPEGDGIPLPPFEGTIVTWAERNPQRTFLELDGTYVPPLGAAGEAFDEAIGRKIAQRTAKDLLAQIAAAIATA